MEHAAELRAWIDGRGDEMAALVSDLVALDTENPPGRGLGTCGRVLEAAAAGLGLDSELLEVPQVGDLEEPCLVRVTVGEGPRTVYFHGHLDVVPAQSRDQFQPRRAGGRITGRGSADMKGGLVGMLYGAAAAAGLGLIRDGRIVLHVVCDEETGSAAGSAYLRDAGLIDAEALAMVTAEPTGGVVWHASRGGITMRVTVHGREAHVGRAHEGDNAFAKLVAVARPLVELSHELLEKRTKLPVDDEAGAGSMLVVGGAAGAGANFNVVPGVAWFSLDRRFNPEEDLDEEVTRLTDTIADAAHDAGAELSIEILQRAPAGSADETGPTAQLLRRCVAAVEGEEPRFLLCPGVLETRWYAQLGIPAYGYGPGRLDVSHGPDEYVEEEAVRRCAAVYGLFAAGVLADRR